MIERQQNRKLILSGFILTVIRGVVNSSGPPLAENRHVCVALMKPPFCVASHQVSMRSW